MEEHFDNQKNDRTFYNQSAEITPSCNECDRYPYDLDDHVF